MCVKQILNQTAQLINKNSSFTLFIYIYVWVHEADAEDTQAEQCFPSRPLGVMSTAHIASI